MDIRWKNNKRRIVLILIILFAVTAVSFSFFPVIVENARVYEDSAKNEINENTIQRLYNGSYVLYLEAMEQTDGRSYGAFDLFLPGGIATATDTGYDREEFRNRFNTCFESDFEQSFELCRYRIDYLAAGGTAVNTNTNRNLEAVLEDFGSGQVSEKATAETAEEPQSFTASAARQDVLSEYRYVFRLHFDEKGKMEVSVSKTTSDVSEDQLIKAFQKIDINNSLQDRMEGWFEDTNGIEVNRIKEFTVVYGITDEMADSIVEYSGTGQDWYIEWYLAENNAIWLYIVSLLCLFLGIFAVTGRKRSGEAIPYKRTGCWYLAELAVIGMIVVICLYGLVCDVICSCTKGSMFDVIRYWIDSGDVNWLGKYLFYFAVMFLIYSVAAAAFLALRPVFSLGIAAYVREYSLIYQIFPWIKKKWRRFKEEVHCIDFSERYVKTIFKVIVVNFLILAVFMCMWTLGIVFLIIYSVVLFWLLKKNYEKIAKDYSVLKEVTSRIAGGDFDAPAEEDTGIFEPLKQELWTIRDGFKKAVVEETKSQRMKTELISNVSHDLKTPLTAIMTYVELLKKEDLTDEERKNYIEILDMKSKRLKVLIEDLFEISKATSNTISLNLVDVDVVNLIKQVSMEHTEKFEQQGLTLRFRFPEEKVIRKLDSQKTYRIFENLFMNIQKYAMPGSRVYIDVATEGESLRIIMKNMSAEPLDVAGEELTERFVRGDVSRNTEGSGLGLSIVKSFVEAQKGSFTVEVDGDLFKAIISW